MSIRGSQDVLSLSVAPQTAGALARVVRPVATLCAAACTAAIRRVVADALLPQGALLFRGFAVSGAAEFQQFVRAITPELVDYDFGSTPRSRLQERIYTSTEYPA